MVGATIAMMTIVVSRDIKLI